MKHSDKQSYSITAHGSWTQSWCWNNSNESLGLGNTTNSRGRSGWCNSSPSIYSGWVQSDCGSGFSKPCAPFRPWAVVHIPTVRMLIQGMWTPQGQVQQPMRGARGAAPRKPLVDWTRRARRATWRSLQSLGTCGGFQRELCNLRWIQVMVNPKGEGWLRLGKKGDNHLNKC